MQGPTFLDLDSLQHLSLLPSFIMYLQPFFEPYRSTRLHLTLGIPRDWENTPQPTPAMTCILYLFQPKRIIPSLAFMKRTACHSNDIELLCCFIRRNLNRPYTKSGIRFVAFARGLIINHRGPYLFPAVSDMG